MAVSFNPALGRSAIDGRNRITGPEDVHEDVTAPRTRRGLYLNQSFLSIIANVGSPSTFDQGVPTDGRPDVSKPQSLTDSALTYIPRKGSRGINSPASMSYSIAELGRRRSNHARGWRQPPHRTMQLDMKQKDEAHPVSEAAQIPLLSPGFKPTPPPANALQQDHSENETQTQREAHPDRADSLAHKISTVFRFPEVEEVIEEFPCWLLQNVLLQGQLYITSNHICYYAYLPKRPNEVLKSGWISKRGRQNPRYRRYWFVLKGDVLYYYHKPTELYFPRGTIDIRSCESTNATMSGNTQSNSHFSLKYGDNTLHFEASSPSDAEDWIKQLQRVIFRSNNAGDSIKISFPIKNILDVEESRVLDYADTLRIRVIDNEETFAIDEYFFSFFQHGAKAKEVLGKTLVSYKPSAESSLEPVLQEHGNLRSGPKSQGSEGTSTAPVHVAQSTKFSVSRLDQEPSLDQSNEPHTLEISLEQISSGSENGDQDVGRLTDSNRYENFPPMDASQILGPKPTRTNEARSTSRQTIYGLQRARGGSPVNSHVNWPQNVGREEEELRPSTSFTRLQDLVKAGMVPFQRASGLAGALRSHSKRVGSLLARESYDYYDRVSSMWAGKLMHYDVSENDSILRTAGDKNALHLEAKHGARFREHFALDETERLRATYYAYLYRGVPIYGKVYVGARKLCFRSLLPGTRTKMTLPLRDMENVSPETGFRFGYSGLVIVVRGHEEIFFEFRDAAARDDCGSTLLQSFGSFKALQESRIVSEEDQQDSELAKAENELLNQNKVQVAEVVGDDTSTSHTSNILFNDIAEKSTKRKPSRPLRITCLTIGSRGDVQPYIALCKGLLAEGHQPTIATHAEYETWVVEHGIGFAPVAGDPGEIMRLCVENDMFTIGFLREAQAKFRGWIDQLLITAWEACQGSDLLIESPSAMAGIHIAEALKIPYFRAFTMPWTRTRAYPHAFAVPSQKMGGNYNSFTYVMFDNVFWKTTAGQVNRWREKVLGISSTNLEKLEVNKVPFLYNFSPSVVAPPLDYSPWIHVTGYWFLDEGVDYEPPEDLLAFINKARADGKKLVYVGFGSIVVEDPAALTTAVVDGVTRADVRCILSKGWSDRLDPQAALKPEIPIPDTIFPIKSAPHDWLFAQVDAAAHHGGAGTTGASLRAGIPTIVKPFFGDQYFFGSRVEDLGVGKCLQKINTKLLARTLWEVTNNERIIVRARMLGERIRAENGVQTAIDAIYGELEYAETLVKQRNRADDEGHDEEWTLVGLDEADILESEQPEFESSLAQRPEGSFLSSGDEEEATDPTIRDALDV